MSNYSKFKERKPQDTIFEIHRILNGMGLFPVVNWVEKSYEGARANRVTIYPTTAGANGKGTDELYATASGYAEVIERLNNGILVLRDKRDSFQDETGFIDFPDEKVKSIREILDDPDPFTKAVFATMGMEDPFTQTSLLKAVASAYGEGTQTLPVVPFADPARNTVQWLPIQLVHYVTGSNGMASGNTLEEAMVQAVSEIFERAVSRRLVSGQAVPPVIPDEVLREYSFYRLIEQVRAEGKYRVTVYDCTLGRDYPVAATCIANLETGTFGMKVGAHPSFAVAVERTLTEALQGRNMEEFARLCRIGTLEEATSYTNYPNVSKTGTGIYPMTMFTEEPGWAFRPWKRWEGLDNRGFLAGMLQLMVSEGYEPLARDTSFLGFPSCLIVVPGFSDLYPVGRTFANDIYTLNKVTPTWSRFPNLTREEEERMLKLIRFKENSVLENNVTLMSQRPLSERYLLGRIAAWLALKLGQYAVSAHFFHLLAGNAANEEEAAYYLAMRRYAKARGSGLSGEQARTLIRKLFREETARRVVVDTEDESKVMERQFRPLNCYDCEHCEIAGEDCDYINVRRILLSAAKAMRRENVDQDALLEELKTLISA